MDDILGRLYDEKFSNWLKVSIGLSLTTEGLNDYVKYVTVTAHRELQSKLGNLKICTTNCSRNEANISRWCKTCKDWLDGIMKYNKQSERNIKWTTMDSAKWPTNSEEMGHVFTTFKWNQDGGRKKLKDDILKVISFLINCKKSTVTLQLLTSARDVRNKLAHRSSPGLSERETAECLDTLTALINSPEIFSTVSGNTASVCLGHLRNIDFVKIYSDKNISIDPILQDLKARVCKSISEIVIRERKRYLSKTITGLLFVLGLFTILLTNLGALDGYPYLSKRQQGAATSKLNDALLYGNTTDVKYLTHHQGVIDETSLLKAVQTNGDVHTLVDIVFNGALWDPKQITRAIDSAIDLGKLPIVTYLHNKGGMYSIFALLTAVRSKTAFKSMVEFICNTGNWTDEQKEEALHESCFRGNLDIFKYLQQNGAKYNEFTLLTAISGYGDNQHMVEFVLKTGHWSESQKSEALEAAIFRGKLNTVRLLHKMKASYSNFSLLTAARSEFDDKHLLEFVLTSGSWTKEQMTETLDTACYRGKLNTVILLHQYGAQYSPFSLLTSVKSPGDNKFLIEFVFKTGSWTEEQVRDSVKEAEYLEKTNVIHFLSRVSKSSTSLV